MLNNQGHLVIFQVGVQSWMIDLLLSVWSCLMQHTVCSNVFPLSFHLFFHTVFETRGLIYEVD